MARSLRSKRRQKNQRVRRKKFGEREVLKAWEHQRKILAEKDEVEMSEVPAAQDTKEENTSNEEIVMDTDSKTTKKDVAKWRYSRNQLKKRRKLQKNRAKKAKTNHHKHI